MKTLKLITAAALLSGIVLAPASSSAIGQQIDIFPRIGDRKIRLGVADFTPRTVSPLSDTALKIFNDVLWQDLKFSAFFDLPSKSFYPLKPIASPQDVSFENWRVPTINAEYLAFGNVQADQGGAIVEAYLYDVKTGQQVLGKRYTVGETALIRKVAHEFADQVVFQLSAGASKGVARTRIAYSTQKGRAKEIQVMDYDGANTRTVTANGGLNKFPEWLFDNSGLAFVANLPGSSQWQLWLQNLTGGRSVVEAPSSYVSSPALSRDGRRIAFSSRGPNAVDADVFAAAPDGSGRRNLTNHPGIDTSPSWSPGGQQIAFISDRSGTPQLWLMDADGSNVQRLVAEGGHCDSPDWSPDGRWIAYSWQAPEQWKHDIFLIDVATRKIFQVTSGGGSNEHPHWSPDGRHIVFQSSRRGGKQIYIMNADGQNLTQLTSAGLNEGPSWSGYLE